MTNDKREQRIREMRNEYARQWRAKNPEKVKKHMEDYWFRQYEARQKDCNAV